MTTEETTARTNEFPRDARDVYYVKLDNWVTMAYCAHCVDHFAAVKVTMGAIDAVRKPYTVKCTHCRRGINA